MTTSSTPTLREVYELAYAYVVAKEEPLITKKVRDLLKDQLLRNTSPVDSEQLEHFVHCERVRETAMTFFLDQVRAENPSEHLDLLCALTHACALEA